jgi:uncharacterized protein YaeQ
MRNKRQHNKKRKTNTMVDIGRIIEERMKKSCEHWHSMDLFAPTNKNAIISATDLARRAIPSKVLRAAKMQMRFDASTSFFYY